MSILYCMRQRLDYVELYPVTNLPVTISELDIDVQLVHQFSKIPGHKIKAGELTTWTNYKMMMDGERCPYTLQS